MFKNILIPISSEFYLKDVLEKGAFLAEKFQSKVTILYIIEEKTICQTEKRIDTFRTVFEKEETKKVIIDNQKQTADVIIFFDAKNIFKDKGIIPDFKILEGEFSTVIENETETQNFDLVLIGYEKDCLLKYRILDYIDMPIWVTEESGNRTLLAVCSNLTPNQKIPEISRELAQIFNWNLHLIYIVDVEDNTMFDENSQRFVKKSINELINTGQSFVDEMQKKGISARMISGSFGEKVFQNAKQLHAGLIVIGKGHKRSDIFGFSAKSINHKIVEKCKHSVLFLN